jgi:hypothetical protein
LALLKAAVAIVLNAQLLAVAKALALLKVGVAIDSNVQQAAAQIALAVEQLPAVKADLRTASQQDVELEQKK